MFGGCRGGGAPGAFQAVAGGIGNARGGAPGRSGGR